MLTKAFPEFAAIAERTLIVCYDHDDAVTKLLSSQCHVRVIWGGDATVRAIRSVPLSPLALEITFADRFSFAVLGRREFAALKRAVDDIAAQLKRDDPIPAHVNMSLVTFCRHVLRRRQLQFAPCGTA